MRSAKKGRHGAALRDNGAPLSSMMLQKRSGGGFRGFGASQRLRVSSALVCMTRRARSRARKRISLLPVPEKSVESSHPCAVDTLVLHPFRQDTAKFLL